MEFSGEDGETQEVTFQVKADDVVELDETIDFALSQLVTATPLRVAERQTPSTLEPRTG